MSTAQHIILDVAFHELRQMNKPVPELPEIVASAIARQSVQQLRRELPVVAVDHFVRLLGIEKRFQEDPYLHHLICTLCESVIAVAFDEAPMSNEEMTAKLKQFEAFGSLL